MEGANEKLQKSYGRPEGPGRTTKHPVKRDKETDTDNEKTSLATRTLERRKTQRTERMTGREKKGKEEGTGVKGKRSGTGRVEKEWA